MNMEFTKPYVADKTHDSEDRHAVVRHRMVKEIIAMTHEAGDYATTPISEKVLSVMDKVPRHRFIPEEENYSTYYNRPLLIGYGQTISQPYIVALMTELLALSNQYSVLEVGTGYGYQTAILAEIAG